MKIPWKEGLNEQGPHAIQSGARPTTVYWSIEEVGSACWEGEGLGQVKISVLHP